ncbi:MAG: hypothetical protein BGO72_16060 [Burkholderiales bacterium 70-64]|nr:MAG: hypothetical protein BGO72_16060 [Burkholderiales bacterium 70-64]
MALGACAVTLITGCAQTGPRVELPAARVEPVYRVEQPVGTAAGQYAVGRMDMAAGRIGAAIERFRRALQLDPGFVDAHNGLGVAYGQQGRFEEAIAAFRSALASGPAHAHVLNNLGYAQLKAGHLDEAWESLTRAFELDAYNTHTRENLRLLAELRREATRLAAMPAPAGQPAPERVVVSAITAPVVEIVERDGQAPVLVPAVVAAAQSMAAAILEQSAEAPAEAGQPSSTATAVLVQLAPNLYELRAATSAAAAPVPAMSVAAASAAVEPVAAAPAARVPAASVVPAPLAAVPVAIAPAAGTPAAVTRVAATPVTAVPAAAAPVPATFVAVAPAPAVASDGVEVSNGVGVRRLAGRTARQLSRFGIEVARVSDYRPFGLRTTEIHYRSGHLEGAMAVQRRLPVSAKLVSAASLRSGVNVRLVVGRDMVAESVVAWWSQEPPATTVAQADFRGGWRHL